MFSGVAGGYGPRAGRMLSGGAAETCHRYTGTRLLCGDDGQDGKPVHPPLRATLAALGFSQCDLSDHLLDVCLSSPLPPHTNEATTPFVLSC